MSLTQASLCTVPVSHCIPVHPTAQVQVLGVVQVPLLRQGLVQMAVIRNMGAKADLTMC